MRIAILHYHLKRGGVTRVIESSIESLEREGLECITIAGEIPDTFKYKASSVEIPGLRYSNAQESTPPPEELLRAIKNASESQLGGPPDLWHIHNHSLGKNASMPGIINLLAKEGAAMLLQMHDFAEDGRPGNHALNQSSRAPLYLSGARIHYACINQRDFRHFQSLGLPSGNLHLLTNPVPAMERSMVPEVSINQALGCDSLILYPVRAVRRKNFGEMLLWAAVAPEGTAFATTLGPTNLNFRAQYESWRELATRLQLPVHFSISETLDWPFEAILTSADGILTTSVAEGFGLAFLEPWLFGKSIIGRDLPAITADFKAQGIQFDQVYTGIRIPASWIDMEALRAAIGAELEASYRTYGKAPSEKSLESAIAAICPDSDHVDFGGLNELFQAAVIEKVCSTPDAKAEIARQLPLPIVTRPETISSNASIVRETYGLAHYGQRLAQLYRNIASAKPSEITPLDADTLLERFLDPENFRLLRT
jgi:hypothetical protein